MFDSSISARGRYLLTVRLEQVLEQIALIVESSEIKDTISKEDFKTFMLPLMRRSVTGVEG